MGLLDDLKMGFGLKARTEDYDARTARNIAAREMAEERGRGGDAMALAQARNPSHFSYIGDDAGSSGGARRFLDRTGGENYNPQVADDDRSILSRLIFSPESPASPTPYAIGPVTFDEPLRVPTMFGLLGGLLGNFGRGGDEMGPPQTTIRPMLRPQPISFPVGNGQPETTFTENRSGVDVYNPATDYTDPDFSDVIPATEAAKNADFLDTIQSAIDAGGTPPLSSPDYYDPLGSYGMREGTSSIIRLPNGRFVDTLTGRYI